jgi:hypothetical protein
MLYFNSSPQCTLRCVPSKKMYIMLAVALTSRAILSLFFRNNRLQCRNVSFLIYLLVGHFYLPDPYIPSLFCFVWVVSMCNFLLYSFLGLEHKMKSLYPSIYILYHFNKYKRSSINHLMS